jgi:hypothetical protein
VLAHERVEVQAQLAIQLVFDGTPAKERSKPVAEEAQAAHVRRSG